MAGALMLMVITLLAYVVKSFTGFGPALVVISLGSVLIGAESAVVLASLLDLIGGAGLLLLDRRSPADRRLPLLAGTNMAGAVLGGSLLRLVPAEQFTLALAAFVAGMGLWMLVRALCAGEDAPPARAGAGSRLDSLVTFAAGVSGGLFGVGGPLLVVYFGGRLAKQSFRGTLVPVLVAGALARVAVYAATGLIGPRELTLAAISLPVLPLGLLLGNRLFHTLPERAFGAVVALLVFLGGLRMLF